MMRRTIPIVLAAASITAGGCASYGIEGNFESQPLAEGGLAPTTQEIGGTAIEGTLATTDTTTSTTIGTIPETSLDPSASEELALIYSLLEDHAATSTTTTTTSPPPEEQPVQEGEEDIGLQATQEAAPIAASDFEPNSIIGSVSIPAIGVQHNLLAGSGEEATDQGFALHTELGIPGIESDKNILIGGHRQSLVDGRHVLYNVTQLQLNDTITVSMMGGATKTYRLIKMPFIGLNSTDLYNFISPDQDNEQGVPSQNDLEQLFLYSCAYDHLGDQQIADFSLAPAGALDEDARIFFVFEEFRD